MKDLTSEEFDGLIYDDEQAAVILFHKEGCSACQEVSGKLESLNEDYNIVFAGVDAIKERELFSRFGLKGVPQVLFFREGRLINTMAGKHELSEYINSIELLTEEGAKI